MSLGDHDMFGPLASRPVTTSGDMGFTCLAIATTCSKNSFRNILVATEILTAATPSPHRKIQTDPQQPRRRLSLWECNSL